MSSALDRLAGVAPVAPDTAQQFADSLKQVRQATALERLAAGEKPSREKRLYKTSELDPETGRGGTEPQSMDPGLLDPLLLLEMVGPGAGIARVSMRAAKPLAEAAAVRFGLGSRAVSALEAAIGGGLMGPQYSALSDISRAENPLPNLIPAATAGIALGGAIGAAVPGSTPSRAIARSAPAEVAPVAPAVAEGVALEPVAARLGPTTGPKVEQVFKTEKFGLEKPSPELESVNRVFASLGLGERRVRTFGDMEAAAQELGMDPERLLRGAARRPISDAEVVATSNLINQQSELHAAATRALTEPGLTEPQRRMAERQAAESWSLLESALKRQVRGGTEAGRAVVAFRIVANKNLDPAYWYTVAQKRLGGKPFTPELKATLDAAIGSEDRAALARIVAGLGEATWYEKLSTIIKAMMLSNPGTDIRNIGGNTVAAVAHGAADIPAAALDWLVSKSTGIRTKTMPSGAKAQALGAGIRSGMVKAGEVARWGDTAENFLAKYDFGHQVHFDNRALEFSTQLIFRRLGMEDIVFREPHRYMALAELAEVTAKNEGKRGAALIERMAELLKNPTETMTQLADETAAYRTFNKESAVASGLQGLEKRTGAAGKLVGTVIMPFKRTPINVAATVFDFSPFGIPKAAVRWIANRKGDQFLRQRYLVEGLSRPIVGAGIAGFGWALYRAGLAVGGPPSGQEKRNYRRSLGIPDYAVKMGDTWVSINNNAPGSNLLMMGIEAAEQFDSDKAVSDKLAGSAFSATRGMTQQTFFSGVRAATEAATDPGRYGGNWLESLAGMVVPSLVGAVARGTDPIERRIEGPGQAIMAKIPGLRQQLEPQVDARGELRRQTTGVAAQVLSPVRISPERTDLFAKAVKASGWSPGVPRGFNINNKPVQLAESERTQFQREMGEAQRKAIERIASQPGFFRLTPEQQRYRMEYAITSPLEAVRSRWRSRMRQRGNGR